MNIPNLLAIVIIYTLLVAVIFTLDKLKNSGEIEDDNDELEEKKHSCLKVVRQRYVWGTIIVMVKFSYLPMMRFSCITIKYCIGDADKFPTGSLELISFLLSVIILIGYNFIAGLVSYKAIRGYMKIREDELSKFY